MANLIVAAGNLKIKPCKCRLSSVTKNEIETLGVVEMAFNIGKNIHRHNVTICEGINFPGGILAGTDFLSRLGDIKFNFYHRTLNLKGTTYPFVSSESCESLGIRSVRLTHSKISKFGKVTQDEEIAPNSVSIIAITVPFKEGSTVLIDGGWLHNDLKLSNAIAKVENKQVQLATVKGSTQLFYKKLTDG